MSLSKEDRMRNEWVGKVKGFLIAIRYADESMLPTVKKDAAKLLMLELEIMGGQGSGPKSRMNSGKKTIK